METADTVANILKIMGCSEHFFLSVRQVCTLGFLICYIDVLQMVELELRKLEETVHSIHEEMMFLRERYAMQSPAFPFSIAKPPKNEVYWPLLLLLQGRRRCRTWTKKPTAGWPHWACCPCSSVWPLQACSYGTWRVSLKGRRSFNALADLLHRPKFIL